MSVQGKRPASGHPENPQAKRLHTVMTPNPIAQQNSNLPCSQEELERLNKEIHLKVQELYGTILSNPDVEQRAEDVAARLEVGMVWINSTSKSSAELPFGGVKRSGVGRELGRLGIEEFANHKLVRSPGGL